MGHTLTRRGALSGMAGLAMAGIPAIGRAAAEIRIGRSLPLSGPFAEYGQQRVAGADLYFESINKQGGIAGQRIALVTLDDAYDAARLKKNIATLDEREQVQAMFGTLGPGLAASLQEFPERKLPLIAATAGFSLRTPAHHYIFPMRPGFAEETAAIVRHITTVGFSRICIVRQEGPLGTLGETGYLAALKERGTKPVATVTLKTDGSDAAQGAQALLASGCDCAVLSVGAATLAKMVRAHVPLGKLPAMFSVSAVNTSQLIAELGERAVGIGVSQVVPGPTNSKYAVVREYAAAIGGSETVPSIYGLEGFLEAKLLVTGLQRAARGGGVSRATVTRAFDTLGEVDLGGYKVSYQPGVRTGSNFVDMTFIARGGKIRS